KKFAEAKKILVELSNNKSISYYSIIDKNRLSQFPPEIERQLSQSRGVATSSGEGVENNTNVDLSDANGEKEVSKEEMEADSEETMTTSAEAEDSEGEDSAEEDGDVAATDEAEKDPNEVKIEVATEGNDEAIV